ncbi:MAG: capsule assembly Wzi family protein [Rhodothermales bacterium]
MRSLRTLLLTTCLSTLSASAFAQSDGLLQINDPIHNFLAWEYAAGRLPYAFLSHQPLSAYEARIYLDRVAEHADELNDVERQLLARYRGEATLGQAKRLHDRYGVLYANGTDFISSKAEDYSVQFNPLLYLSGGIAHRSIGEEGSRSLFMWQNTRGARFSGGLAESIFFETRIEENQRIPGIPQFDKNTAPRLGSVKFKSGADRLDTNSAYDYFVATGVVGARTKHFEIRFGRDRNLWGIGKSSVELSNYATVYDQLQIRTTVGRFQYTNLFAAFSDLTDLPSNFEENTTIPRKYGAFHRLALNVSHNIKLGLFEAVVFAEDSTRTGFDVSYLNPVIFYRAVESDRGSSANVVAGGDFEWLVRPGFLTYVQVVIDEFKLSELGHPNRGWWANKWSWMGGFEVLDPIPGIPNLRMRVEYTRTRPFTFSHRIANQGYIHYEDLLGHPSGPNSEDVGLFFTYQPKTRIFAELNVAATIRGRNSATENFGSDPGVSYLSRDGDFGHQILQGIPQNRVLIEGHGGYELFPNLFFEAAFQFEHIRDGETGDDWYFVPMTMLRWGLPFQSRRY